MACVELHFHILPGIDDGPGTVEESVQLAAAAVADGTRTIVATPHVHPAYPTDPLEIPDRVRETSDRLRREGIRIDLLPGAEVAHDMVQRLSQRQLEAIAHGPDGRRWLLLEASLAGLDESFTAAAQELRGRGFTVVVAHPERAFANFHLASRILEAEIAAGSAIQVNAWSLAGLYGERVRLNALRLLQLTPRAVIASDAHGTERMPSLSMALAALEQMGEPNPRRFASTAPQAWLQHGLAAAPASPAGQPAAAA